MLCMAPLHTQGPRMLGMWAPPFTQGPTARSPPPHARRGRSRLGEPEADTLQGPASSLQRTEPPRSAFCVPLFFLSEGEPPAPTSQSTVSDLCVTPH